jgi:predicted AlkP superfamily phosphohydrolase/phosphomutase
VGPEAVLQMVTPPVTAAEWMMLLDGLVVGGLGILARAVQEFAACVKGRSLVAVTPHVKM